MTEEPVPGPLVGRRVLDLTTGVAGPAATQMLGFLGAEVIRVTSAMIPRIRATDDDPGINVLYLNKECVRLNLRDPRGLDLGRRLAAQCDIVVENQRPGSVARLGLGYEALRELRPDIIAISLSASGQGGPAEHEVGYAPNFVSRSGVGLASGYPGGPPGEYVNWPDLVSAQWLVFAVLYALLHRERTGEGQYLDLSANESLTTLLGDLVLDSALNGRNAEPQGNREPTMAPHAVYRCAGEYEWVSIAIGTDGEWLALCEAMGRPELAEDPRFAGVLERLEHEQELDALIGEWTSSEPPGRPRGAAAGGGRRRRAGAQRQATAGGSAPAGAGSLGGGGARNPRAQVGDDAALEPFGHAGAGAPRGEAAGQRRALHLRGAARPQRRGVARNSIHDNVIH